MTPDPPFYADHLNLLVYQDADGNRHPVRTAADWEIRRAHILANMQLVMGPMPDDSRRGPLDVQTLEETDFPRFTRQKITYAAEPGDRVPAYLFLPRGLSDKAPAMLCPHQTTAIGKGQPAGLGDSPTLHFAVHLAERGYVTLAPDYPNYGDYRFDPYANGYISATMKGIWNHSRAVDLLQSLPAVDGERIGVIGHSLGGHNSIYVAVFDTRIRAVISSCGFNAFPKYMGGDLAGWSHKGYMPRIAEVYGKDPKRMPFDFPEVIAALAPRPFFTNSPVDDDNFEVSGVRDCIEAARPIYALLGAADKIEAVYPVSGHDFADEPRKSAYAWLDRQFRRA
jgi:dienelactone hydrolase